MLFITFLIDGFIIVIGFIFAEGWKIIFVFLKGKIFSFLNLKEREGG